MAVVDEHIVLDTIRSGYMTMPEIERRIRQIIHDERSVTARVHGELMQLYRQGKVRVENRRWHECR